MIQSYLNNLEKSINKYKHIDVNLSTSQRLKQIFNKKSRQRNCRNTNQESDSNMKILPVIRRDNSVFLNSSNTNTMLINNNSIYFDDIDKLKKKKKIKTSFVLKASNEENSCNINTKNPLNMKLKFNIKDENNKHTSFKYSMLNYQPPVRRYDYNNSNLIKNYNLKSLDKNYKLIKRPNFENFDAFKKFQNLHYITKETHYSKINKDQISHRLNLKNVGIQTMKNPNFYVNKAYSRVSNLINK
jgi:hypothetical protein